VFNKDTPLGWPSYAGSTYNPHTASRLRISPHAVAGVNKPIGSIPESLSAVHSIHLPSLLTDRACSKSKASHLTTASSNALYPVKNATDDLSEKSGSLSSNASISRSSHPSLLSHQHLSVAVGSSHKTQSGVLGSCGSVNDAMNELLARQSVELSQLQRELMKCGRLTVVEQVSR
jgi:hypothetical protein